MQGSSRNILPQPQTQTQTQPRHTPPKYKGGPSYLLPPTAYFPTGTPPSTRVALPTSYLLLPTSPQVRPQVQGWPFLPPTSYCLLPHRYAPKYKVALDNRFYWQRQFEIAVPILFLALWTLDLVIYFLIIDGEPQ